MIKRKFIKTIIIAAIFFAGGYFLSYQLHSSKHNLTDKYMDGLINKYFNDHYAGILVLNTYDLALIHKNLEHNKITEKNKNTLNEIIKHNIELMDLARKDNTEWGEDTNDIYLKLKKWMSLTIKQKEMRIRSPNKQIKTKRVRLD